TVAGGRAGSGRQRAAGQLIGSNANAMNFKYLLQWKSPLLSSAVRFPGNGGKLRKAAYYRVISNADYQPTRPKRAQEIKVQVQVAGLGRRAVSSRRLFAGDDAHAEETQLGHAQSGEGPFDQRLRNHRLHSGGRT